MFHTLDPNQIGLCFWSGPLLGSLEPAALTPLRKISALVPPPCLLVPLFRAGSPWCGGGESEQRQLETPDWFALVRLPPPASSPRSGLYGALSAGTRPWESVSSLAPSFQPGVRSLPGLSSSPGSSQPAACFSLRPSVSFAPSLSYGAGLEHRLPATDPRGIGDQTPPPAGPEPEREHFPSAGDHPSFGSSSLAFFPFPHSACLVLSITPPVLFFSFPFLTPPVLFFLSLRLSCSFYHFACPSCSFDHSACVFLFFLLSSLRLSCFFLSPFITLSVFFSFHHSACLVLFFPFPHSACLVLSIIPPVLFFPHSACLVFFFLLSSLCLCFSPFITPPVFLSPALHLSFSITPFFFLRFFHSSLLLLQQTFLFLSLHLPFTPLSFISSALFLSLSSPASLAPAWPSCPPERSTTP
ncbi:uncharacterized protein [Emydura macquarii macquarii]|uniref:uncharacterized protein n=1 Tax=Emydura macquarii macquarii TaxID=1129001 RepID=UPI00352A9882